MTTRTNTRFWMKLWDVSELCFPRSARGHPARRAQQVRCVGSCGTVLRGRTPAPTSISSKVAKQSFMYSAASVSPRRVEHSQNKMLKFSPEQMYNIVADVDQYSRFVPWCKKSRMMKSRDGEVRAELEVGFPPFFERYVSELSFVPNHQVKAVCRDGTLFRHLETVWRFSPGPEPNSCHVDFYISFEFKSLFHSHLAGVLFEETAKEMVAAFESRAASLYRNSPAMVKKPS